MLQALPCMWMAVWGTLLLLRPETPSKPEGSDASTGQTSQHFVQEMPSICSTTFGRALLEVLRCSVVLLQSPLTPIAVKS